MPRPRGKTCARCNAWYRPSRHRSAGKDLEYCSRKCQRLSQAAGKREPGDGRREW